MALFPQRCFRINFKWWFSVSSSQYAVVTDDELWFSLNFIQIRKSSRAQDAIALRFHCLTILPVNTGLRSTARIYGYTILQKIRQFKICLTMCTITSWSFCLIILCLTLLPHRIAVSLTRHILLALLESGEVHDPKISTKKRNRIQPSATSASRIAFTSYPSDIPGMWSIRYSEATNILRYEYNHILVSSFYYLLLAVFDSDSVDALAVTQTYNIRNVYSKRIFRGCASRFHHSITLSSPSWLCGTVISIRFMTKNQLPTATRK